MAADGNLEFDVTADTDSFDSAMRNMESESKSLTGYLKELGSRFKNAFSTQSTESATSRMMSLEEQIRKAENALAEAEQKQREFATAEIPTEEYVEIQNQIDKTTAKLDALEDKREKFIKTGGDTKSRTFLNMEYQIDECKNAIDLARGEQEALIDEGKAYTLGSDNAEQMQRFSDNVTTAQNRLDILNQRMAELEERESEATGYAQILMQYIQETCPPAGVALKVVGMGFKAVEFAVKSSFTAASKLIPFMITGMKKVGSTVLNVASHVGKLGARMFSTLNPLPKLFSKATDKSGGFIKKLGGMVKRVFVFTVITKALREIRKIMGNLFTNDKELSNYFAQIKGNLITAFAPIYEFILPGIKMLMSALATFTAYLANVTSRIFGKTIAQSQALGKTLSNQAKETDKTAKSTKNANKQLASYDELNVMQDNSSDEDSDTIAPKFDTKEMSVDWVDKLKEMMAGGDWEGIGKMISNKMADSLEMINWSKIKKKCRTIAAILARTLNGFFSNMRLATDIGTTIAEAFNTGLESAYTFLKTFDFEQLGQFLGAGLNGAISSFDWKLLGQTFGTGIQSAIDTVSGFVNTYNWGSLASGISTTINTTFDSIDFAEAGTTLGNGVKGIFTEISTFLEEVNWKKIGKDISTFIKSIDWSGVASSIFESIGAALGAAVSFLWGAIEDSVKKIRDYWNERLKGKKGEDWLKGLKDGIVDGFKNIGTWIKEHIFDPFIKGIKKAFGINSPSKVMTEYGGYIMEGLKNGIEGFVDKIKAIFTGIKDFIKGIVNGIIDFINGMISGILGGINSVIEMLNKLKIDLPDIMGGGSIGFSLNKIAVQDYTIPHLAKGAVIPPKAPFLAMLGDQQHGTNIETPLDTMIQAFETALAGWEGNGSDEINVNVYLEGDARGLYKVVRTEAQKQKNRTGKPDPAFCR